MENKVLELLRETKKGYHPLVSLLDLSDDQDASITEKITCHKEIAKYIMPQLKSVDTKVDLNAELGALRIVIDNGDEEKDLGY